MKSSVCISCVNHLSLYLLRVPRGGSILKGHGVGVPLGPFFCCRFLVLLTCGRAYGFLIVGINFIVSQVWACRYASLVFVKALLHNSVGVLMALL